MLSLFTPTHNPVFLPQVYDSLKYQGDADWEWVITPSPSTLDAVQHMPFISDPRVRVVEAPDSVRIGELKHFACQQCRGDSFIELDHDDLLVPFVLEKITAAFATGADFVYSDAAVFNSLDLRSRGYSPEHGWEHYPVTVYGHKLTATRCFDIHPRMLCEVYYAPDHVRGWRRESYEKVGGHNIELDVGDDHDLICRTYLAGAEFKHIGGCGYLYRWHQGNTVQSKFKDIKQQQNANRDKYFLPLVVEWCRRHELPALNLMQMWKAGRWKPNAPTLLDGQELKPDSSGLVTAANVIQFIPPDQQLHFFNTVFTHLVPGGFLSIIVPSEKGRFASMNPLHRVRYNLNSFLYYTDQWLARTMPEVTCRFGSVINSEFYPDQRFSDYNMLCIRAELMAIKGPRLPGPAWG